MKILSLLFIAIFTNSAFAYSTCEQEAESAAKALARINRSHAKIVTGVYVSEGGETIEVTLDNYMGGQSVTYTVWLTSADPCTISKIEITGEE